MLVLMNHLEFMTESNKTRLSIMRFYEGIRHRNGNADMLTGD